MRAPVAAAVNQSFAQRRWKSNFSSLLYPRSEALIRAAPQETGGFRPAFEARKS
jgi:hypothetical protein